MVRVNESASKSSEELDAIDNVAFPVHRRPIMLAALVCMEGCMIQTFERPRYTSETVSKFN